MAKAKKAAPKKAVKKAAPKKAAPKAAPKKAAKKVAPKKAAPKKAAPKKKRKINLFTIASTITTTRAFSVQSHCSAHTVAFFSCSFLLFLLIEKKNIRAHDHFC